MLVARLRAPRSKPPSATACESTRRARAAALRAPYLVRAPCHDVVRHPALAEVAPVPRLALPVLRHGRPRGWGSLTARAARARACGGGCPARCVFHSSFPPARWRQQRWARDGGGRSARQPSPGRSVTAARWRPWRGAASPPRARCPHQTLLSKHCSALSKHCQSTVSNFDIFNNLERKSREEMKIWKDYWLAPRRPGVLRREGRTARWRRASSEQTMVAPRRGAPRGARPRQPVLTIVLADSSSDEQTSFEEREAAAGQRRAAVVREVRLQGSRRMLAREGLWRVAAVCPEGRRSAPVAKCVQMRRRLCVCTRATAAGSGFCARLRARAAHRRGSPC